MMIPSPYLLSRRRVLAGLAALTTVSLAAQEAASPTGLKTLISPFTSGSSADLLARRIAAAAASRFRSVVAVENHPGGSGLLAVQQLIKSPHNGETLLLANSGLICNTPLLVKPSKGLNPQTDLVPVCIVASAPFFLFAGRQFPAGNLVELQSAFANVPEGLSFAANEPGSANHVAGEVLLRQLKLAALHVPYKNSMQAVIDVAEGRVQVGVFSWQNLAALRQSGALRLLAVLANDRLMVAPDVLSVREQGFGPFTVKGWHGLFAPRDVPADALREQEQKLLPLLRDRDVTMFIGDIGFAPDPRGQAASSAFVATEIQRYRALFETLKLV